MKRFITLNSGKGYYMRCNTCLTRLRNDPRVKCSACGRVHCLSCWRIWENGHVVAKNLKSCHMGSCMRAVSVIRDRSES